MVNRIAYFARETLVSLRRNLLMTLAGIITVAVSLCVLGGALLLSRLVDHGTQRWKDGVELEIFMRVKATQGQTVALNRALAADRDVRKFRYINQDDAYKQFKQLFSDQPDLVATTGPEDLPPSFRVAPQRAELTTTVADRYETHPGVDEVKTAEKEVRKLLSATSWIRRAFLVIFFLLLAASLVLIVNTIRLATFARRREIEVMKLVGASNWFVRIPFMLEGLVQGVIGAAFAFGAVYGLKEVVSNAIVRDTELSRGFYLADGDAYMIGLYVLALGALIGVIGSIVGLRRFIEV
jgi:cell division transport system permease protein